MLSTKVGAQELAAPTAFLMVPAARSAEITKNVVAESTLMNVIVKRLHLMFNKAAPNLRTRRSLGIVVVKVWCMVEPFSVDVVVS